MRAGAQLFTLATITFLAVALSCGGTPSSAPTSAPPPSSASTPALAYDVCHCAPTGSENGDYRHAAKHAELPATQPQVVTVDEMLKWDQGSAPARDAPRTGRELQVFQIPHAFLQNVYVNPGDCDIHFEISATPEASAPRVIVETPDNASYCTSRQEIQKQIAAHGLLFPKAGDVIPALPVMVTGMALLDYEHKRGTALVATTWELHPAVVTILPQ